ncbi:MAG: PIN domain-containing protein [Chloroflexi bacterium]|nr:PIN domain-containing protein [Chloroflexota bacterium]
MAQRLKVLLDADVIFAGSAAPTEHSASNAILQMGEITLIECVASQQAVTEVERNMAEKLPAKLPELRLIVSRCLHLVPDPEPVELTQYTGQADTEDLPILVAALREGCTYLLTFNIRHYHPTGKRIAVQRPGEFMLAIRERLSTLAPGKDYD